mgnify:CR=1 FL=1
MGLKIALILSVILQFATAFIALSLVKRTRANVAWWLISGGFLLMAIRRLFELFQVFETSHNLYNSLFNSWIGVAISVIMLLSLSFIKRIFNIQKRIDELKKQNEARVFSAIIKTEENERQGFAKELHDGLGPLLSSVKMSISALSQNVRAKDNKKILDNTENLIDESINTLKEISNRLSPHVLNNFGLYRAVKSFINRLQIVDEPVINLNSNIEDRRFSKNIEVVLYRVICELIANTLKHGNARNIYIDLFADEKTINLKYLDDGQGFDREKMQKEQNGHGYANIESRIKSINGSYDIYTSPGEGFNMNMVINIK